MNELHAVGDEIGSGGLLREALGDEAETVHLSLDHVWLKLSNEAPRFLPPEFRQPTA